MEFSMQSDYVINKWLTTVRNQSTLPEASNPSCGKPVDWGAQQKPISVSAGEG